MPLTKDQFLAGTKFKRIGSPANRIYRYVELKGEGRVQELILGSNPENWVHVGYFHEIVSGDRVFLLQMELMDKLYQVAFIFAEFEPA